MNLGLTTSLRTEQRLLLSPQILQRIEVLQLPALDLAQLIEQELQDNETLETADDGPADPADEADAAEDDDARLEELYDDEGEWHRTASEDRVTSMDVMVATAEAPLTLADHLGTQLDVLDLPPRDQAMAAALLASLNDRGWLELALEEVEIDLDPPATLEEREHALHIVQGLDPPGIGARDMTECLLLQLDPDDPEYALLVSLVVRHLDDMARNRIPRIAKETGSDVPRVLAAIEVISHLDPIPGRRYGGVRVPHVRPDVLVRRVKDDFELSLENDWVPELTISRSWLQMARDRSVDPELRKHIRGKIEGARSLIDAIEQRKHTLFRVASELVTRQAEFLEHGPAALRPLRMQEVADALGVHVSTVSRSISGKYLQTPRGILPMKQLFTGEVAGSGPGEQASRASVQELVREVIASEDKHRPLSDEAIVGLLKRDHGLDIARRTVTKYRKAMNIGSSRARRIYGPS